MKRKVCIITGTRAEYGLLYRLMGEIDKDPELSLQIICSCMHLSPEFGSTFREIEADGFTIDKKIEMLLSSDTPVGISKSMGLAFIGFCEAYSDLTPDIAVILGDRFEAFCAASTACVAHIPVAHIHGGEVTQGAIDDSFRHAITKMSHLHFTSTEDYRRRVIQLGEHPDRVFNVGSPGNEYIKGQTFLTCNQLGELFGFPFEEPFIIVTFHPATLEETSMENQFQAILEAIDEFPELRIIFTYANADAGGRRINSMINEYVEQNKHRATSIVSMGQINYLSAMYHAAAVVGNSSSGIIETPSLKIPTINVGDRQKGRIMAESVIDCIPSKEKIVKALKSAFSPSFLRKMKTIENPYEQQGTSFRIKEILKTVNLNGILKKQFYDIAGVDEKDRKKRLLKQFYKGKE
jgi:UDP-hydrolysing UDP-N-acetyl-D-glucosamine 2-epimerase